jgi:hypothetical protein
MSTTVDGVRIVDMPDLGAFNSTSSLVGERAGSGRFSASGLTNYLTTVYLPLSGGTVTGALTLGGPLTLAADPATALQAATRQYVDGKVGGVVSGLPWLNVRDYGAKGDGTTNDTAAVQAAITAAKAHGGVVMFNPGVYMLNATLELPTKVIFRGAGVGITVLRAMASTAFDIIQTTAFASLTGTGSVAGTYQNGVFGMTLDGNKAAGRSSGRCIALYGYDYRIEDVECANAPGVGFYSEWGSAALVPVAAGGNSMEAHILRLKTFSCGGDGLVFNGPHDSYLTDVTSFINTGRGIVLGQNLPTYTANGAMLTTVHSYGNQQVGIQVDAQVYFETVQGENNRSTGGIAVSSGGSITGSNVIAYENTGFGVQLIGSSNTISGMFLFDNSGDGLDIVGVENFLTNVSSTHNVGSGIVTSAPATRTTINGVSADSNGGAGISIGGGDTSVTGLLSIFNTGVGAGVANGLAGIRLEGEINNNGSGVQLAFNVPAGACLFDLAIFTVAGQTAWTGTPGLESFMRIVTTGSSIMPLNVVPHIDTMAAGSVGEYVTATVAAGSAISVASGVASNVTTINLTAGDWDVSGTVCFNYSTQGAGANAWVSTVSSVQPPSGSLGMTAIGAVLGTLAQIQTGVARMSLSAPTVVYLGASSGFGTGTSSVFGTIQARRVR